MERIFMRNPFSDVKSCVVTTPVSNDFAFVYPGLVGTLIDKVVFFVMHAAMKLKHSELVRVCMWFLIGLIVRAGLLLFSGTIINPHLSGLK